MDLTLKTKEGYFNYRVAAVIVNDGKILAQRNTKTNEYYLPGGRVTFGETSEEALLREIKEELKIAGKKNFHTDSIQSGGVRIFYKKKFRLNLLIIFASRTTDI